MSESSTLEPMTDEDVMFFHADQSSREQALGAAVSVVGASGDPNVVLATARKFYGFLCGDEAPEVVN